MSEDERANVVAVARTWLGTPYHDGQGLKHVGVDCAYLLARVYAEAGLIARMPIEAYAPDWFLHRSEERFLAAIERHGHEIAEADVKPGDIAIWKLARCFAHGAIVVAWPGEIIHALKVARSVITSRADEFGFAAREVRFFSLWQDDG